MAIPNVPISRIEQYLDQIAQNTGGGGGGSGGGGGGGIFVVHVSVEENQYPDGSEYIEKLDKTWQEIWDAVVAEQIPIVVDAYSDETVSEGHIGYINNLWAEDGTWGLQTFNPNYDYGASPPVGWAGNDYTTGSADGYPSSGGASAG